MDANIVTQLYNIGNRTKRDNYGFPGTRNGTRDTTEQLKACVCSNHGKLHQHDIVLNIYNNA